MAVFLIRLKNPLSQEKIGKKLEMERRKDFVCLMSQGNRLLSKGCNIDERHNDL